jgi:hypothetical protein
VPLRTFPGEGSEARNQLTIAGRGASLAREEARKIGIDAAIHERRWRRGTEAVSVITQSLSDWRELFLFTGRRGSFKAASVQRLSTHSRGNFSRAGGGSSQRRKEQVLRRGIESNPGSASRRPAPGLRCGESTGSSHRLNRFSRGARRISGMSWGKSSLGQRRCRLRGKKSSWCAREGDFRSRGLRVQPEERRARRRGGAEVLSNSERRWPSLGRRRLWRAIATQGKLR